MPGLELTQGDGNVTCDTLFDGRLRCLQHRAGYRFSLDAILAAHFSTPSPGAAILDLCGGCGIIALICLHRWQSRIASVSCLELQPALADLAARNRTLNGWDGRMEVVAGDLRRILDFFPAEHFSQVICNPPFYRPDSGRPTLVQEALIARHQVCCTLSEVAAAAAVAIRNRGKAVFVYPASGLDALLAALHSHRLVPKRLQSVYSFPGNENPARLVLVEAVKNGGSGLRILSPFYIHEYRLGPYSKMMQRLYDPAWQIND